jgi:tetratricopeptide (TPR) repeat protein
MKIALCAIVKDDSELNSLMKMTGSAIAHVDGVFITANGKETDEIELACKQYKWNYSYLPWHKDFSEQRNFNFSQVPADYDYILWMDADDVLVGGEKLREVAKKSLENKIDVVFFTYWYGCLFDGEPSEENLVDVEIEQNRERLIKPGSITWKKRLHETPIKNDGYNFRGSMHKYSEEQPMAVLHLGAARNVSEDQIKEKMKRNREILELELADEVREGEPDPRTQLYLMKIYAEMDEPELWEKTIEMGIHYLEKSGWDEERATAYILMAKCWGMLGDNQKPIHLLHKAIEEDPYKPNQYLKLAEAYYNVGLYDKMYHWLEYAMQMPEPKVNSIVDNVLERKMLAAELLLKYYFNANKNTQKAYLAAKELYKLNPTENNHNNVEYLRGIANLDTACRHTDKLWEYLESIGEEKAVLDTFQSLPQAITSQPFAINKYQKYAKPRIWGVDEICYFANFGKAHFEKWDASNLDTGIGGSETAVISLAEEWVKRGWKVTVYGDPVSSKEINGVIYLPWYRFNRKDKFNIFIQWRSGYLAEHISSKKFYVDLHDLYHPNDFKDNIEKIDKIFVKSKFHRNIAKDIPDDKFIIASNGL